MQRLVKTDAPWAGLVARRGKGEDAVQVGMRVGRAVQLLRLLCRVVQLGLPK